MGRKDKPKQPKGQTLYENLRQAEAEINTIKQAINYTTDGLMLENLIYELKASELRYRHFLSMIRATHNTMPHTFQTLQNQTSEQ